MKIILHITVLVYCVNSLFGQVKDEASAIKQLLEKESATWRSGNVKAHADCWQIQSYSKILVSTGDGRVIDVPPSTMINPPSNAIGKGGVSINSNYKINISGHNAWVSHDEVSTANDGVKTYSYEIRILEKIKGKWKLVGQSIHISQPK